MSSNRDYSNTDVDMLMASETIAGSFQANIADLSTVRTDWTPEYAKKLKERISKTIEDFLGVDAKKDQRNATAVLAGIQAPAKRDVAFFKTQIDDDFKKDPVKRKEFLKSLGFTDNLRKVQQGNQEALVSLLFAFKTNMTAAWKTEITAKGVNPALIERISGYAATLKDANVSQETKKSSSKEVTQEVADTFNAIYGEIIGICKKASSYYNYEPLKKDLFTFSKVVNNLGPNRPPKTKPNPPAK